MEWMWGVSLTVALLAVAVYGINSLLRSKQVTVFPLLREEERPTLQAASGRAVGPPVKQPEGHGTLEGLGGGGLAMIAIEQIMKKGALKIQGRESVKTAADRMAKDQVGSLLVEDGWGEVQGIVTETDIVRRMVAPDLVASTTLVEQIMSAPVITIDCGRSLKDADELMDRHHIRHLAVTKEGRIVGVLSVRDLLRPICMEHGA
jgi:CBS domain-containing protein